MRAITLTQPWATLVAIGAKSIETRSWYTPFRGPLAIHAAKGYPANVRPICLEEPFLSKLKAAGITQYGIYHASNNQLPLGAIVATCDLVDCVQIPRAYQRLLINMGAGKPDEMWIPPDYPEFSFGDYTPGRYALILANVRRLPEPIPATGALGLWRWIPPAEFRLEDSHDLASHAGG